MELPSSKRERIRASEGDYVRWKGGSCEFERRSVNGPAWQLRETSSRGSRVCTHRERNTKWSGKHRQCFLLSFFFLFSPLPSPPYFVEFVLTGLSKLCRVAYWTRQDCVPFAPFFRFPREKVETLREMGWRENWWLLLLEYTRECSISRKCSRGR